MNKKRWVILGTVVGLGVAATVFVLPRFLDVDRYRPWVVEQVNRSVNGRFELGRLKLTLWGRLAVRADGAQLKDRQGQLIAKIPEVEIAWPWSSVFAGRPELSLRVHDPEIQLVRTAQGKWNVLEVVQHDAPQAISPQDAPTPNGAVAVPALVLKSKLNLEIASARIQLNDALTGTVLQLPGIDLRLKDLSLNRPFGWELGGRIQYALAEGIFAAHGTLQPEMVGGEIKTLAYDAVIDATQLTLRPASGFLKSAGQGLVLETTGVWSPASIVLKQAVLKAGKWKVAAQGRVDAAPADHVAITLSAPDLDLAQLREWMKGLPEVSGQMALELMLQGAPSALQVQADVTGKQLQMKVPQFPNEKPQLDFAVHATLDRAEIKKARLQIGKDVVEISGALSGLRKAPDLLRAQLRVQGGKLDLDRLGLTSKPGSPEVQRAAVASSKSASPARKASGAPAAESIDAQWMTLSRSPWLQKAEFVLDVALAGIVAQGVELANFRTKLSAQRGKVDLSQLAFQVFEGNVRAHALLGTESAHPALTFGGAVDHLNLKQAAESQWALFKNTLEGRLDLKWDAKSPTLDSQTLLKQLAMRGGFVVRGARFATVDIGKLVVEKINGAIDRAADKVPGLRGKRIQDLPEKVSFYESVSSDFTLAQGKLDSPRFLAKPQANAGIEISGPYSVQVVEQTFQADWTVSDPYNVTHAADLSVNVAGADVPHILVESGRPLQIPLQMGCALTSPCVAQDKIVEHFAKVAAGNLARAAGDQLKRLIPGDVIKKFW